MAKSKINPQTAEFFMHSNLFLDSRTIYLGEEIDEKTAGEIIKSLHVLASSCVDTEVVTIILNCCGGDVGHGLAIYDFIKSMKQHVEIHVFGQCHSMAVAILQAGDKRVVSPHSSLMIHYGEDSIEGMYNKETKMAWLRFSDTQDSWYEDIILDSVCKKKPEFTLRQLRALMSKDTIFLPLHAVEMGLADEVLL